MSGSRSRLPTSYQFSQLQRDLAGMSRVQRRQLRAEFARVGQAAVSDARSRAGAWSRRIPSAITGKPITDATRGRVGFELRVDVSESVPHARVFEGISQQGSSSYFRHPVFGNAEVWVSQPTRPYLWPAVRGRAADLRRGVEKAVDDAARDAGFR